MNTWLRVPVLIVLSALIASLLIEADLEVTSFVRNDQTIKTRVELAHGSTARSSSLPVAVAELHSGIHDHSVAFCLFASPRAAAPQYARGRPCGGDEQAILHKEAAGMWMGKRALPAFSSEYVRVVENHNYLLSATIQNVRGWVAVRHDGWRGLLQAMTSFSLPSLSSMCFGPLSRRSTGWCRSGSPSYEMVSVCSSIIQGFVGYTTAERACHELIGSFQSSYWILGLIVVLNFIGFPMRSRDVGTTPRDPWNPVRLLLSTFAHGSPLHLLNNMVYLLIVGKKVMSILRCDVASFLILYFAGAIASAALSILWSAFFSPNAVSVGASGALSALGLFVFMSDPMSTILGMPPLIYIGYLFASDFVRSMARGGNLDIFGHLGGSLMGYAIGAYHMGCLH